jgi:HSP20 family protein
MPWDPVRDLLSMQERLESLFGRATPGWSPPVDLAEFEDRYVLTLEVPGLARSDVQIEYAEPVLTVRGSRPDSGCCPERYQQLERGQGPFARAFRFDRPVAAGEVTADMADGVLTIVVPKATTAHHRIEVT